MCTSNATKEEGAGEGERLEESTDTNKIAVQSGIEELCIE